MNPVTGMHLQFSYIIVLLIVSRGEGTCEIFSLSNWESCNNNLEVLSYSVLKIQFTVFQWFVGTDGVYLQFP